MNRKLQKTSRHSMDLVFILMLLCVFAFGSLMMVMLGANIYQGITEDMDDNFQLRTPLSYVSAKVHQSDATGAVSLQEKDGVTALVLETLDGDEICETWLYEYEGKLYEIYISQGAEFGLTDGFEVLPSYGLTFSQEGNLLTVAIDDSRGNRQALNIGLRSVLGGGQ